jgi:hypothetical protein
MPRWRVPVKCVTTVVYEVEADSAEEAMDRAYRVVAGEEDDADVELVDEIDGDDEIYYPDIDEVG